MAPEPCPTEGYAARLMRLIDRWDPRGILVSDAKAIAAVKLLADPPPRTSQAELATARWVYDKTVHPVLDQPIPSAFRTSSFIPMTSLAAIGLAASPGSAKAAFFWHLVYQTHSATVRYCNYDDTSRPLDLNRMLGAYAASTGAACAIGVGALRLAALFPAVRLASQAAPHIALGCAGALSTVLNNEPLLKHGAPLVDERGEPLGCHKS
ncbi:Tricarboxylate/iron carrier [Baffinella frigidus]|nr:Tricarboxylate/iron carrier [Cryptophyta sp. CCMP2293]